MPRGWNNLSFAFCAKPAALFLFCISVNRYSTPLMLPCPHNLTNRGPRSFTSLPGIPVMLARSFACSAQLLQACCEPGAFWGMTLGQGSGAGFWSRAVLQDPRAGFRTWLRGSVLGKRP